jgi:hypothetical protein
MQEWKIPSEVIRLEKVDGLNRIAGRTNGLAHIVEQDYNEEFKTWYGAVDITVKADEWANLMNKEIGLILEDGRQGQAYVLSGSGNEASIENRVIVSMPTYLVYIVGVSSLKAPRGSPDKREQIQQSAPDA